MTGALAAAAAGRTSCEGSRTLLRTAPARLPLPSPLTHTHANALTPQRTEWLDKRNTIFGRVAGDTIYNVIKFNDYEVGAGGRLLSNLTL